MRISISKQELVPASILPELLDYDPLTGIMHRRVAYRNANVGDVFGYLTDTGYLRGSLKGRVFLAHRVAWAYAHNEWPSSFIDHINHNRADNRLANLRLATMTQNHGNRLSKRPLKGAYLNYVTTDGRERWKAIITVENKRFNLGTFGSEYEAHVAYRAAAIKYFGPFACTE